VANGLRNLVEISAPDPFIIVEVRISPSATAARTVARGAILRENRASLRARKICEPRIGRGLLQRCRGKLVDHRAPLRLERLEVQNHRFARMPAERARGVG